MRTDEAARERTWNAWRNMKKRCLNPRNPGYKNYGARGITVCARWLGKNGWKNFRADMGDAPLGMTLERRDNDLGYSPSNCLWASWNDQARNRRTRRFDVATVAVIRKRLSKGESVRAIAREYDVQPVHIRAIRDRKIWS